MKLSEWARKQGISYKTAWRWVRRGKMPVPLEQTPTGTILVEEPEGLSGAAALYTRVSSADPKADLNDPRPKLMRLLSHPKVKNIVVEHRDRLMRFGFEYAETALAAQGRRMVVVEPGDVKDDRVQDMLEVVISFCARLYGRRSARNKAKKALEAIEREG